MQQAIKRYGVPLGLYSDRHTIFHPITPQAKGRIERLWVTFQDRLVIELRLLGVTTIEEANRALLELLRRHNQKFAVKAKEAECAYMVLEPSINLEHVFSIREHRQLGTGNTLSYKATIYTLAKPSSQRFQAKMVVEVRETLTGEVLLWHNKQALTLVETPKPEREQKTKAGPAHHRKPDADHPWKKGWSNPKPDVSLAQPLAKAQT